MDEASVGDACLVLLRDEVRALDVTQEVFVKCLHHREKLRTGPELMGWLYRVATNLCLNQLRDGQTRRDQEESLDVSDLCHQPKAVERIMTAEVLKGMEPPGPLLAAGPPRLPTPRRRDLAAAPAGHRYGWPHLDREPGYPARRAGAVAQSAAITSSSPCGSTCTWRHPRTAWG